MRRVLIALALAVACACEQKTAPLAPPVGLWNTAWRLEDLGGIGVIDNAEVTLESPERGKAVGHGTCNPRWTSARTTSYDLERRLAPTSI